MLKILKCGRSVYFAVQKTACQRRLFLTEAYRCEEAWNRRLESPLLKNVKVDDMYYSLEQTYSSEGKINAVDVDVFANIVSKDAHVPWLLTLLHNLRQTTETTYALDSMHHAVIRYLLQLNHIEDLMNVLNNRLDYGIFPDYLCYNILMDTFIKKKEYGNAARIGVLPMLQEDSEHSITNSLSVYSCHKYLKNPDDWKKPEPVVDDSEEVKIRVAYIRNPYFDDHFDLTDPRDLVGKTLAFHGKHMDNVVGRTCQLRGLILYKKYDSVLQLLKKWSQEVQKDVVYEEVLNLIKTDISYIPEDQKAEGLKAVLSELSTIDNNKLCKNSLIDALENHVKSAIDSQADDDVHEQCQTYLEWDKARKAALDMQAREIQKQVKMKEIERIKQELQERETLLTFFENEEKIEMEIRRMKDKEYTEKVRVESIPRSATKLKKLKEAEVYIPPDI